jgi:hypothetical protein
MSAIHAARAHDHRRPVAFAISVAGMLAVWPIAAFAQTPVRLSDEAVKKLIEQVYDGRDKFEGNLDDSVKRSMMKTATTDASISAVLQDLQDNANKLKDRFTKDYAAGAEAETFLKQATMINAAMERAPITKGRTQWDQLVVSLKSLAGVYGTTFPVPEGASVRRMNDGETSAAAEAVASSAEQIRKQIDKNKALAKPDKAAGKEAADDLVKAATTLRSKIGDSKPATGELRQVSDLTAKLGAFLSAHPTPTAAAASSSLKTAIGKLHQSFMVPATPPPPTM